MKSQRQVWGETMVDLAKLDQRVLLLDADLATSTQAVLVADQVPEKFIQIGIAEQNMIGVAAGLASAGYRPWVSSFGVFLTHRVLDQVRMLVSQTKLPIRLAAHYSGLLNGASGKTHQDLLDLAIMRALPNLTVLAPADATEAEDATRWAADHDGPVYIRLARDAVPDVFPGGSKFRPELPRLVSDGQAAVVVTTGVQTARLAGPLGEFTFAGDGVRHIHLPSLKPLDTEALIDMIGDAHQVITVEDHTIIGGLGGLLAEILAEIDGGPRLVRLGLADGWSESGSNDFLLDKYGLSVEKVLMRLRDALDADVPMVPA